MALGVGTGRRRARAPGSSDGFTARAQRAARLSLRWLPTRPGRPRAGSGRFKEARTRWAAPWGQRGAWVAGGPVLTPCPFSPALRLPPARAKRGALTSSPGLTSAHRGGAAPSPSPPGRLRPAGLDADTTARSRPPPLRLLHAPRRRPAQLGAGSRVACHPPCSWDLRRQRPRRTQAAAGQGLPRAPTPWPRGGAAHLPVPKRLERGAWD